MCGGGGGGAVNQQMLNYQLAANVVQNQQARQQVTDARKAMEANKQTTPEIAKRITLEQSRARNATEAANRQRRGLSSTVATSPLGAKGAATTTKKQLLGE